MSRDVTEFSGFAIRSATPADIGNMALLLERAVAAREGHAPLPDEVVDPTSAASVEEQISFPGSWGYIAEDTAAGRMAGFTIGHDPKSTEYASVEYLALLFCDPTYWGRGIGTVLLRKAVETARLKAKSEIFLWTGTKNARARSFYEYNGFQLTGLQRECETQGSLELYSFYIR